MNDRSRCLVVAILTNSIVAACLLAVGTAAAVAKDPKRVKRAKPRDGAWYVERYWDDYDYRPYNYRRYYRPWYYDDWWYDRPFYDPYYRLQFEPYSRPHWRPGAYPNSGLFY